MATAITPTAAAAAAAAATAATAVASESVYTIVDGLRYVREYTKVFRVRTKQRWLHRALLDVLCTEFRQFDAAHYTAAIADGQVTVNGKRVGVDYVLRNADAIEVRSPPPQPNPTLARH